MLKKVLKFLQSGFVALLLFSATSMYFERTSQTLRVFYQEVANHCCFIISKYRQITTVQEQYILWPANKGILVLYT